MSHIVSRKYHAKWLGISDLATLQSEHESRTLQDAYANVATFPTKNYNAAHSSTLLSFRQLSGRVVALVFLSKVGA